MGTHETCRKAVAKWGQENEIIVCIEELSELQKELCKFIRGLHDEQRRDNIAEEIADVEICLETMRIIFGNRERVEQLKEYKLKRLEDRIIRNKDGVMRE